MKSVHNISIRVFCLPDENIEEVERGLLTLLGYIKNELVEEKISFNIQNAKGFNDKTIKIITVELNKDRNCNHVIANIRKNLSIQDKELLQYQQNRLDERFNLFIRFDKNALANGQFMLTDSGDCYHLRFSISAFPKSRESALKIVKEMFNA